MDRHIMRSMAMQTNVEHKMFFNTLITGEYNMVQGSDSEVTILSSCDGDLYFSNVCKHLDEHWTCKQAQKCHFCFRMNSTFRAYLLPERPKLRSQKHRVRGWTLSLWFNFLRFVCWNSCGLQFANAKVQMERKIVELEDDMKEYWGFYLLKDSHYK